jgi:hypothetical protein
MNNRLIKWVKPFVTFGIALAMLAGWVFLVSRYDWAFLGQIGALVYFLFFVLIVESASQANPSQVASPIKNFFAKYSSRRDKVVVITAYAGALLVLFISMRNGNHLLISAVLATSALAVYYGICLVFGTRELKELVLPYLIKKKFYKESIDKNKEEP